MILLSFAKLNFGLNNKMTNILFICKWNRFRSKVAEAIFNKINKNKKNKSKSAGIFPGFQISKEIFEACKKAGYPISKKVQGISHPLLMWSDVIIVIEDTIPLSVFNEIIKNDKKKVIVWKIKDTCIFDERKTIIKIIKNKINLLIKNLK